MAIEFQSAHIFAMEIFHGVAALPQPLVECSLTIGNFDGVHRGHQELLARLKQSDWSPRVVYTFDPHPSAVLRPEKTHQRLFDVTDQMEQLEKRGVDIVIVEPFTRDFSQISAADFFNDYLVSRLHPKHIVVGHDFAFGANREGDSDFLHAQAQNSGIETEAVSALSSGSAVISSSRIRSLVREGNMAEANRFLGRNFYRKGTVVRGDGRGRTLGFPTANVQISADVSPKAGVYAGWAIGDKRRPAIANLGTTPTFLDKGKQKFEVHILEPVGDIYGTELRFEFLDFIREEKKFASVDELKTQIDKDILKAQSVLNM